MEHFYDDFISREKYWFSQNNENDKYLSYNYGHLIDDYNYDIHCKPILGIMIYDQLTRHYYRKEINNHILIYFNQKALEIAKKHILIIKYLKYVDWMFFMLVFRHSNIRDNLLFVMNECWKISPLPIKFIRATYSRANFKEILTTYDYSLINYDTTILDNYPSSEILTNPLYQIGKFDKMEDDIIIISLSGGVDSVVCLYNAVHKYQNKTVIAIHINYNNRAEVEEEVKFLRCLCAILNVKLYVRKIAEIKRKICMENDLRDVYESYTKRIRFNSYKALTEGKIPIIILGHNKDDCFENILTNISNKSNYDNLSGMQILKEIEEIMMWRPFLNIEKKYIIEYAITNKIPYLYDSTPEWSVRGKIRDKIKPAFLKLKNNEDIEEDSIIDAFFDLKEYISNTQNIFNELIINNLTSKLDYNNINKEYTGVYNKKELQSLKYLPICELFFKKIKVKCSYKALKDFSKYISNYKDRSFVLSKTCIINIKTDNIYNNCIIIIRI